MGAIKRKRGRPQGDDYKYIRLLDAWEDDAKAHPEVAVKVRISTFLRKRIPEKVGLKIGGRGMTQGALFDALARGRWAREMELVRGAARRQQVGVASLAWLVRAPAKLRKRVVRK